VELSLLVWLLPTLALVIGVVVGFVVARLLPNAAPSSTQRQLDDIQKRFDSYQNEVVTHFNSTAVLVKKLTQSYQDVQDHLAEGANSLALDEVTRQRLLAALHSEAPQGPRDRLTPPKDTAEVPRDYAPKAPNSPGMLDESYGLKREAAEHEKGLARGFFRFTYLQACNACSTSANRSSTSSRPTDNLTSPSDIP